MHKRFIRGLSCLLILTILSELIPSAMFNSIIQPIHAVEMPELVQDYIVTAPYPTENGTTAEVPPTIIEGDSLSSSADGGIEETIRLTESDKQYLLLLQNTSSYSQLSTSDKQFLCTYTGVSDAIYNEAEQAGYSLVYSVNCGQLAVSFDRSLSEITALHLSCEEQLELLSQISMYTTILDPTRVGSALDTELREYIWNGCTCEQVFNAYAVGTVLEIPISELLADDSDAVMPSTLEVEEINAIVAFAQALNIAAHPIAEAVAGNRLSVGVMETSLTSIRQKRSEITVSTQGTLGNTSDGGSRDASFHDAPYMYTLDGESGEKVALNTGALILETEDYVLPGRPGLDLVIGRQYNSEEAMITYPWVSGYTYVDHYYYVFYRVYTVVFVNDGDAVPISETYRYGCEGPFTDKDTALACANHFSGLVIADEDPETGMLTMDLYYNVYVQEDTVEEGPHYYATTEPNTYLTEYRRVDSGDRRLRATRSPRTGSCDRQTV